jgi:hypothetical protein
MSNDKKVAQDRREKVKKEKQELFEKVCLCLLTSPNGLDGINYDLATSVTDEMYLKKKGIK